MKVNVFMGILALIATAIVGYAFYASGCNALQISISTLMFAIYIISGMSLSVEQYPRSSMLIKVTAFTMLVITLIADIILIAADANESVFIIINGLLLVIALSLGYMLYNSKQ